jgi:hypothetical protein
MRRVRTAVFDQASYKNATVQILLAADALLAKNQANGPAAAGALKRARV